MIASTQITITKIFAFITVPVVKLLSRRVLFINRKDNKATFSKITNFTVKLLQSYKKLECEVFRLLLKHVKDHLSVLFQFA